MPYPWPSADYHVELSAGAASLSEDLVARIYGLVARVDVSSPGFCLISLAPSTSSFELRATMNALRLGFDRVHRERTGRRVVVVSAGRFDQQVTTKPHRDGGPDESMLVLGYEPTEVDSEVALLDYAACARDLGITPAEFLDRHNPMLVRHAERLAPYTTPVEEYSKHRRQILAINNSVAPLDPAARRWQGVLHTATIPRRDESQARVINSMMIASVNADDPFADADPGEFLTTHEVLRRGYG